MTTLCYIEQDGKYLMLHRNVRKEDINKDKWIGVGGHFEAGESPEECLLREVKEETGLTLLDMRFRGIITFVYEKADESYCKLDSEHVDSKETEAEYMCLYTSNVFEGELLTCDEGELCWIPKEKLHSLNLWEGDKIFLDLLQKDTPFFTLKLRYQNDVLLEHTLKIYE